jgi:magnesium transporter
MAKLMKNLSMQTGKAPGTLVHIGERKAEKVEIELFEYSQESYEQKKVGSVEDVFACKDSKNVSWINITGVHDVELIGRIGAHFGIHSLVLEDIVNTGQRPKSEDFGDYIYIVLKMVYRDEKKDGIVIEQVSLIVGKGYVISFQEIEGDVFGPLRSRIRGGKGFVRKKGADYLAYALMDAVIDNYFIILEDIGDSTEKIEEKLVENPSAKLLKAIHALKRNLIIIRKAIWPLREILSGLQRSGSDLIEEGTMVYLADIYDHAVQVLETVEAYRDMASGMLDVYMSGVSNKMNEVMKFLTVFATIFIPLTFVAGIYGMNFKYMPELEWHWGYFAVLGFMVTVVLVMLLFFKKKKWL